MKIPAELKYTAEHEWVREEEGVATVGITDYAQGELGDIVFLELPKVGTQVKAGAECGTIEAVKTVAQLYAPVTGKVTEVNATLENEASLVNQDPYGAGWMLKIKLAEPSELGELLSPSDYEARIGG
jgi:glycine cleavage system H protein